jgi:hypothetical protein
MPHFFLLRARIPFNGKKAGNYHFSEFQDFPRLKITLVFSSLVVILTLSSEFGRREERTN